MEEHALSNLFLNIESPQYDYIVNQFSVNALGEHYLILPSETQGCVKIGHQRLQEKQAPSDFILACVHAWHKRLSK